MNVKKVLLTTLVLISTFCVGGAVGVFGALSYQERMLKLKVFGYSIATKQYQDEGKLDDAAIAAMGQIVLAPQASMGYAALGDVLSKQGRTAAARWAYESALTKIDQGGWVYRKPSEELKAYEKKVITSKLQALQ
jgi:hypothetical protein